MKKLILFISLSIFSCQHSIAQLSIQSFQLNVKNKGNSLQIIVQPANDTVCVNDSATFTVEALGSAVLSYQWQKNNINITEATNSLFSIISSKLQDTGIYKCEVSDSIGSIVSNPAILKVNSPPYLKVKFRKTAEYYGNYVSMSVSPSGTTPFHYQWYNGGKKIEGATNSNFNIIAASGIYRCEISNSCGIITPKILQIYMPACRSYNFIAGSVKYCNKDSTAISGYNDNSNTYVSFLTMDDILIDSLDIDDYGMCIVWYGHANGKYKFRGYTNKKWGGSNPADALLVNRHYIGSKIITDSLKKAAADVNNDGKINPTDALLISRRYIGVIDKFVDENKEPLSDWIFDNPTFEVIDGYYNEVIKAICRGDVNGSFIPSK